MAKTKLQVNSFRNFITLRVLVSALERLGQQITRLNFSRVTIWKAMRCQGKSGRTSLDVMGDNGRLSGDSCDGICSGIVEEGGGFKRRGLTFGALPSRLCLESFV